MGRVVVDRNCVDRPRKITSDSSRSRRATSKPGTPCMSRDRSTRVCIETEAVVAVQNETKVSLCVFYTTTRSHAGERSCLFLSRTKKDHVQGGWSLTVLASCFDSAHLYCWLYRRLIRGCGFLPLTMHVLLVAALKRERGAIARQIVPKPTPAPMFSLTGLCSSEPVPQCLDSRTKQLARRSCYVCKRFGHCGQTRAPRARLINVLQQHVARGRCTPWLWIHGRLLPRQHSLPCSCSLLL